MALKQDTAYTVEKPAYQYKRPVRGTLVWWLRFSGVAAFLTILALQLPRSQEVQVFRIDLRWLGLCMGLTVLQLLLDALAWQSLMRSQGIRYTYPKALVAYLASQYLGMVTPGHVGEFLGAGYVTMDTGITFGYALSSVVVKKALAWTTVIGFGVWGLPLLAEVPFLRGVKEMVYATLVVVGVLSVGITVWVFSLRRLARKWRKLSPWQVDMAEFWAGMRQLASPRLAVALSILVLSFTILFAQLQLVLKAMGIALPLLLVCRIMALSRIAAKIIPMSVVGFGSKDAAIIILLSQHGVAFPTGLTATLLLLVCSYLVTLLLSGVCWWIKPLVIRRVAPSSL